jgi:undecaprenyl pyrophosphate synthase
LIPLLAVVIQHQALIICASLRKAVSSGIKRYQAVSSGIKRYQAVSSGIKRYQAKNLNTYSFSTSAFSLFNLYIVQPFNLSKQSHRYHLD